MWIPAFKNLKQIPAFVEIQLHQAKIINCQEIIGGQLCKTFPVRAKSALTIKKI